VEFVQSLSQEVDHLSKIVEDLLLLARMDAGRGALALGPSPIRLDEIAMEAVSRFKRVAESRGIRLRLNLDETDVGFEARGDGDLLRSMLQNLIDNAIKYSPDGSRVDVSLRAQPLEISVSDQGPGMSEDDQKHVFERFFRAENTAALSRCARPLVKGLCFPCVLRGFNPVLIAG
jgi:signal transduction histidine kinase